MIKNNNGEMICLKKYLTEKELEEIGSLEKLCRDYDEVNLKLELGYRRDVTKAAETGLNEINEFLYYIDDKLVSYLSISCFGGNIGEITGMTHPDFRRKGLCKRLSGLAITEGCSRNFNKLLMLADGKSESGASFIKAIGGVYDFSEYRMRLSEQKPAINSGIISLRKAGRQDIADIRRQNTVNFNDVEDEEDITAAILDNPNNITYMVELGKSVIGKINVETEGNYAFIYGFGIMPQYRGRGCGRAALENTLKLIEDKGISLIELDVACSNKTALNLYKSCGFEEISVMDYYVVNPV